MCIYNVLNMDFEVTYLKFYFDLYSELFKELNQATSLEEIFN
jgi:hypothetical protein